MVNRKEKEVFCRKWKWRKEYQIILILHFILCMIHRDWSLQFRVVDWKEKVRFCGFCATIPSCGSFLFGQTSTDGVIIIIIIVKIYPHYCFGKNHPKKNDLICHNVFEFRVKSKLGSLYSVFTPFFPFKLYICSSWLSLFCCLNIVLIVDW